MKRLSLILTAGFVVIAAIYARAYSLNDSGFLIALGMGAVGMILAFVWKFKDSQLAGEGLLGIAIFLMTANLFHIPLVA
jgi:hypothetical protein